MNEIPNQTVANSGQIPYSRSGGNSMVEPVQEEAVQPQNQEGQRINNAEDAADHLGRIAMERSRQERQRVADGQDEDGRRGNQEEQRKIQESIRNLEREPAFAGFSSEFRESLNSRDRDQIRYAYEDLRKRYAAAKEQITTEYVGRKYPNEELQKAANDEYRTRLKQLEDKYDGFISAMADSMPGALDGENNRILEARLKEIKSLEDRIKSIPKEEEGKRKTLQGELRTALLRLYDEIPSPEDQPLPNAILAAIGKDEFVAQKFISAMIILPQEESSYRLPGLYSEVSLIKFLKINQNTLSREKMDRLLDLVKGTETLHNMNHILKTSIDQFAQVSQAILSSQLTTVFNIRGVQDVFELYEEIIKENLSIETMITDDVFKRIDTQVEDDFEKRVSKKVTSLNGELGLTDWELKRAIIYGRNLVRTLLREAEYISLSTLPEEQRGNISLAYNELFKIFHTIKYSVYRFKVGESQGGIEMLDEVYAEAKEKRRHGRDGNEEASKGIVRLDVLQGTEVGDREATKIIGTRGAFMTWRATEATLREFAILDNGRVSNIAQFFEDHKREIGALREISLNNAWKSEFERTKGQINGNTYRDLETWKKARIERVFGELLRNNAAALGVLVSPIALAVQVPTEVKQMLWEKIAELNPDVMASILTRLEVDREAEGASQLANVKSLEKILLEPFGTPEQKRLLLANGEWKPRLVKRELDKLEEEVKILEGRLAGVKQADKTKLREEFDNKSKERDAKKREFNSLDTEVKLLLRNEKWTDLRGKLRTIHKLRMLDEAERIMKIKAIKPGGTVPEGLLPKRFQDYLNDPRLSEEERLTDTEKAVANAISDNGRQISQDLANIQQATVWFLDDVPTDVIRWENLGQFFNRMIGDFGQYNQASAEMMKFLENPFKVKMSDALDHLAKSINSVGQVIGTESAQDYQNSIVTMYNRYIQMYPRYNMKIVEMIASAGRNFTSKAQQVTRDIGAPSLNKEDMYNTLLTQNSMSILREEKKDKYGKILFPDTFKKAMKNFNLGVWNRIIWGNVRDWSPFFLWAILMQFFKGVTADTKR